MRAVSIVSISYAAGVAVNRPLSVASPAWWGTKSGCSTLARDEPTFSYPCWSRVARFLSRQAVAMLDAQVRACDLHLYTVKMQCLVLGASVPVAFESKETHQGGCI